MQVGPLVERQLFQEVIGRFMSGVTIITTRFEEKDYGLTASAVACLSLEPPMLLVCIHRKSGTCHAVSRSGTFGVNILHEHQGELAIRFAKADTDKFAGVDYSYGALGIPRLEGVLAHLQCRVVEEVTGGTHSVFLAEVYGAQADDGEPLAYYRGKFGKFVSASDEHVYRQARRYVLTRKQSAASPIVVADLSPPLGANPQSVYYALTRLESEGLVYRDKSGVYYMHTVDANKWSEALETRCALETAALEKIVGRLDARSVAELEKRAAASMVSSAFISQHLEANAAFHDFLVAAAGNAALLAAYRSLTAEAVMSHALQSALEANDNKARRDLDELAKDHGKLAQAIVAADLDAARRIAREHSEKAKKLGIYLIDSSGGSL